jgi:ferredoxin
MSKRIAVVVSQGQSTNPAKRKLEEDIVTGLLLEPGIDVTIVPHLYDIKPDSTGHLALNSIGGNLIVLSWLYERASRWILDRTGIRGKVGSVLLAHDSDDNEDEDELEAASTDGSVDSKPRVVDLRKIPNRYIYCLDLRVSNKPEEYLAEIKRIKQEAAISVINVGGLSGQLPLVSPGSNTTNGPTTQRVSNPTLPDTTSGANGALLNGSASNGTSNGKSNGTSNNAGHAFPLVNAVPHALPAGVTADQIQRVSQPTNDTALPLHVNEDGTLSLAPATLQQIEGDATRRWYPVIDFSRCTNCMECIDFCLFGVYGVDPLETILVEQPDNCRKGCPACSRVCPENAIMFPQHKTPAIAGSNDAAEAMKIDLSQLFGAPAEEKSAIDIAAAERDEQLLMAGRDAVGLSVGIPKRQNQKDAQPRDSLDDLVDQLDDLDL